MQGEFKKFLYIQFQTCTMCFLIPQTFVWRRHVYEYHSQDLREMDETWGSFSSKPQRDFEVHRTRPNTFVFLNFTYVIISKPQIFQSRYILYVPYSTTSLKIKPRGLGSRIRDMVVESCNWSHLLPVMLFISKWTSKNWENVLSSFWYYKLHSTVLHAGLLHKLWLTN